MTIEELVEYESICAAEREAEAVYWQQKRLAAQIVAMMGMEHYMAALELADLREGREDEEFNRWGGA